MTDDVHPADSRISLPGTRRNLAKSATRALEVLEYFAGMKRPLRATEISHAFGWHSSSTDQLLKTMVDSGYLIFEAARKLYRPSPRLVRFGGWLTGDYYGGERLYRLLNLVHSRSGEIVTLAVRQEDQMQVVDIVQPVNSPHAAPKGVKVPLIGSALGGAYLASRADGDIRQIIEYLDRHRRDRQDRVPGIMEEVQAIRVRGHASGGIGVETDNWSIAMALPPCDADVGIVLGFAGPTRRIRSHEAELAALMRRCVAEILMP
ncbi:DNA-binding IclR family transcriptional regulator [Sphingobium wenxiniae]|uniref:IclR family transcriptional regulator n=1 Tax=Sphingobium wenxiniae (strain DSM 21828 / CGMCC 1.7748 / JZ-1) TaxID=595605 RepID=A0A562KE63_SPHWJ|nr:MULTISPECIES: helix-turn-helix domain-containing protein [Sphingobium]MBB6190998.1 DNA-binding IclR family transcriptional regulator [Sphingobium wenxiniae]TWH93696.1 IclR family transcriptional regulator [Sphingobium wenxiniae]WRD75598.1 helix-turn-helix domain-containing protein [Sphingobium baderi]